MVRSAREGAQACLCTQLGQHTKRDPVSIAVVPEVASAFKALGEPFTDFSALVSGPIDQGPQSLHAKAKIS